MHQDKHIAIELRGVSKNFGGVKAVDAISFSIPTGSVFGLIGPNGAGKTTTFSMMAGYLKPSHGDVLILDSYPESTEFLKGKVGILPQDALLPSQEKVGSFLVYLARLQGLASAQAVQAVRDVLAEVDGSGWWNTRCGTLSHGMAKRVGLAQALLGKPDVVLLDEPTAGLDPRTAFRVRQIIQSRKGLCTLVVSSHNLHELEEVCDYAAILDHGHLVAHGAMAELTASSEEVRFELALTEQDGNRAAANSELLKPLLAPIAGVKAVLYEDRSRELVVRFDRNQADAEEMIRRVLVVLLEQNARISGITKGRGLEQRVMELTETT